MSILLQDLRYALRSLSKQPGFLISALLVTATSMAAATVVFSITNAYLFRPLPFPAPDRIGRIIDLPAGADFRTYLPLLEQLDTIDWPRQDAALEHVAAWDVDGFTIISGEQPEAVPGAWVTPGFFGTLGVEPAIGRAFTEDESMSRGEESVAVISHRLWQRTFGGDPDILGRSFAAYSADRPDDAETFVIVGVMAPDFWYLNQFTDVLVPLSAPRMPSLVRLRPNVTYEQAGRHLTTIALGSIDPGDISDWTMQVVSAHESYVEQVRPVLVVLVGVVATVLLVACGNLAVLLLVRAVGRDHEISLRRSLGASPGRILRQLVTEGVVLAMAAAGVGVMLAYLALQVFRSTFQEQLATTVPGGVGNIAIDANVLLMTFLASAATAVVFGLVPAATARRGTLGTLLQGSRQSGSDSRRRQIVRDVLIGAEVALSATLLIGAGLMARSALHLQTQELGFEPQNVLKANISLRETIYPDAERRTQFVDRVLEGARTLPGVQSISVVGPHPFRGRGSPLAEPVHGDGDATEDVAAAIQVVSPGYFETMSISVLRGRDFAAIDAATTATVAIISDSLAERLWPGEDAIGRQIRAADALTDPAEEWSTIVGVVAGVRKSLTKEHVPDLYVPYRQTGTRFFSLVARTDGPPMTVATGLQRIVSRVDAEQPLGEIEPMSAVVAAAGARPRFLAFVLASFSLFAACLAVFGLYAVVSFTAAQRRHDVAVRIAVGAQRGDVISLFLRRGSVVVASGLLAGLLSSQWLTRALESQLYGVAGVDPMTYALVFFAMTLASCLAVLLPARRAARCDPMRVLRRE